MDLSGALPRQLRPMRREYAGRLTALAVAAMLVWLVGDLSALPARAASAMSVRDAVRVSLASSSLANHRRTTVLNEHGSASGSIRCTVTMQVNITYTSAVMGFGCSSSSGSIGGLARTSFVVSGPIAHFDGTLTLTSGTGRYGHVAGSALHMSGVVQRHTDSLVASITGRMNL